MKLTLVDFFDVTSQVIDDTEEHLRSAGRKGHELFVLWTGRLEGRSFRVTTTYVPPQTSYRQDGGCGVRVDGTALHELNGWLYEHGETLGAQVHSHPTEAFHSETDDAFPVVTALGGLSLVVAYFCRDGLLASSTAAYRLTPAGWQRASSVLRVPGRA